MAGVTQREVADELGVERVTVGRWERGKRQPKPADRERVFSFLVDRVYETTGVETALDTLGTLFKKCGRGEAKRRNYFQAVTQRITTRAELVSLVLVAGGDVVMTTDQWALLFDCLSDVFKDVPPAGTVRGRKRILGLEAGLALDAATRGMTYPDRAVQLGGMRDENYATFAALRLGHELKLVLDEMRIRVEALPKDKCEFLSYPIEDGAE